MDEALESPHHERHYTVEQANAALPEEGAFISGMGLDFRDFDNHGYPGIAYVALNKQTFPLLQNTGKGDFVEVTASSGLGAVYHGSGR